MRFKKSDLKATDTPPPVAAPLAEGEPVMDSAALPKKSAPAVSEAVPAAIPAPASEMSFCQRCGGHRRVYIDGGGSRRCKVCDSAKLGGW
jgi:hypothetical protein